MRLRYLQLRMLISLYGREGWIASSSPFLVGPTCFSGPHADYTVTYNIFFYCFISILLLFFQEFEYSLFFIPFFCIFLLFYSFLKLLLLRLVRLGT